jgi:zinc/manganese transport system substrate-binding protein
MPALAADLVHDNIAFLRDARPVGQMKGWQARIIALAATLAVAVPGWPAAGAAPLGVVAAENFYGDIARQIGGPQVAVTSILSRPDQDPHEFEASAETARRIADARVVVYNGAGYDPWAARLLAGSGAQSSGSSRVVIEVAALMQTRPGGNPHLWYRPATMPALARRLARALATLDPAHAGSYAARLVAFETSMAPLFARIAALRHAHAGTAVTATEPVFGAMADALGLDMRNKRFQLAIMNGAEPGARDIAGFQHDLRTRAVAALIVNRQTGAGLAARMRAVAVEAGVPVVAVTETEPDGMTYQHWMLSQLDDLARALANARRPR